MSEQFKPCGLQEATHVELNGKVYEIYNGGLISFLYFGGLDYKIGIRIFVEETKEFGRMENVHQLVFPILGIKPLKKKKRKPTKKEETTENDG